MKMIRHAGQLFFVITLAVMFHSPAARADSSCFATFSTTYANSETLSSGSCQTCHLVPAGGSNFNTYGDALLNNNAVCNAEFATALMDVELLDSDGEGNSNIFEIEAGAQPGWCVESPGSSCTNPGTPPDALLDPAPSANAAPIAVAGGPYEGEAGTTLIQFDGSGSSDPDNDALTFAWDFGDGNTATGMMPTHTYASAGNFQVTLIVSDELADSEPGMTTATISAPVANIAPTADPGGPYEGGPGQPVAFDGSGSSDPNDDALTYAWDFGDGAMGSGVGPTHTFAATGTYEVTLVVNDGEFDSAATTTTAAIGAPADLGDGAALYEINCAACHSDPWNGPAVDESLPGVRRVTGARACNISGSVFGTSVFPNGVPEMQFLQGLSEPEIDTLAEYLNSRDASGEQRYVTACAGCHGQSGWGGRVDEDVHGDSAGETFEAIAEESEMRFLACMPESDIVAIADFLEGFDNDNDDDGIDDDADTDDDGDGIHDADDGDDDNDGVSDDDEREDGTDPRDSDTDDDGVDDGDEHEDGTDPLDNDTDDDGLEDGDERDRGTDPKDHDSDDDGVSDGDEVKLGTNPLLADNAETQRITSSGGGSASLPLLLLLAVVGLVRRKRKFAIRLWR